MDSKQALDSPVLYHFLCLDAAVGSVRRGCFDVRPRQSEVFRLSRLSAAELTTSPDFTAPCPGISLFGSSIPITLILYSEIRLGAILDTVYRGINELFPD